MFRKALFGLALAALAYYWLFSGSVVKTPKDLISFYDYIIVGAGSAGAVLAARLSEDPDVSVLLVEAGSDGRSHPHSHIPGLVPLLQQSSIDWQYKSVPQKYSTVGYNNQQSQWPRGKVLGGTSVINYIVHVRGSSKDYDRWANKNGCKGWSWKDVLPYFKKLESAQYDNPSDLRGTDGPMGFDFSPSTKIGDAWVEAAKLFGFPYNEDHNAETQEGVSLAQMSRQNGVRQSTFNKYLQPGMKRPNLHVIANAHVTKVLFTRDIKAKGIEYLHSGKKHKVFIKREVILSAGAVNTPQLLMLSGIGPKEHLEKFNIPVIVNSPAVGQNLKDHIFGAIYYATNDSSAVINSHELQTLPSAFKNFYKYFTSGEGPLSFSAVEKFVFLNSGLSEYDSDLQIYYLPLDPLGLGKFRHIINVKEQYLPNFHSTQYPFVFLPCLNHAKSSGEILLNSSDPLDAPLIDPKYFKEQQDVDILTKGIDIINELAQSDKLKPFNIEFVKPPATDCDHHERWSVGWSECVIRTTFSTVYHPMCTCRMGPTKKNAVVDTKLQVYGVERLRVVDASVFPDTVSGNTNIPVIMVAEKAADIIKEKYASKR